MSTSFPLCRSLGLSIGRVNFREGTEFDTILAADLEKLLSEGVKCWGMWSGVYRNFGESLTDSRGTKKTHTALLIGITPIKRERTATLSEAQVREALRALYNDDKTCFEVIEAIFGTNSEGAGGDRD